MAKTLITGQDVQRLLRLQGELLEMRGRPGEMRRHLLEGMCRIVGAEGGALALGEGFHSNQPPRIRSRTTRAITDETLALLASRYAAGVHDNPALLRLARDPPRGIATFHRRELSDDREWFASGYVNEVCRPVGIGDQLYTMVPAPAPGAVHGMGLFRAHGAPPFGDLQRDLVNWFQQAVAARLYPAMYPESQSVQLSPRLVQTLGALLEGLADKEIAARLDISHHTVRQYTKMLYQRFEVSGRRELMARVLRDKMLL